MTRKLRSHLGVEDGQTMIFAGVLMFFVLMPFLGLAVEGGNLFATYRKMQGAADVAALVGAQDLITSASSAQSDACNYAQLNGFSSCSAATDASVVCVPPQTKSPYNYLTYGGSTTGCTTPSTSTYIEVTVKKTLGTIPIFNIPVTLTAHAVAQHGIPGIPDYAITVMDPTSVAAALKLHFSSSGSGQNGLIAVGPVNVNSTNSAAITVTGTANSAVCGSGWYVNAPEAYGTNGTSDLWSFATPGTATFAPAACNGTQDTTTAYVPNAGPIADPYATTLKPNDANAHLSTGCAACAQNITKYYDRVAGSFVTFSGNLSFSGSNTVVELFPGVYPGGLSVNGGKVYMNPGVYTFNGALKFTGGSTCVYGAPACDVLQGTTGLIPGTTYSCTSADFTAIPSSQWFYYCSPWGFWDSSHGSTISSTAPDFINDTDPSNPTADTTRPLNGVTLFQTSGSGGLTVQGNAQIELADPNPCSGTGSAVTADGTVQLGSGRAQFPSGAASGSYVYPTGDVAKSDGFNNSGPNNVYPSADFSLAGETGCTANDVEWVQELGTLKHQHLHFLYLAMDNNDSTCSGNSADTVGLTGGGNSLFWGIVHTFPYHYTGYPNAPTVSYSKCTVSASGNSGSNGPAFLSGQVIADQVDFGGSAKIEVFNRPGGQATSPGTSLIQ